MLTRCKPLLGTYVEISVPRSGAHAADAAFDAIEEVQRLMSFHSEESDVARLRRARCGTKVDIAPQTMRVLATALELYRATDGLFDIAIGSALVRNGFLPRPAGYSDVEWTGTSADLQLGPGNSATCHRPMLIDLGGIAKGFAVDQALEVLKRFGISSALVNAGGDMRAMGTMDHPVLIRRSSGALQGAYMLRDAALASSDNLLTRRRKWGRLCTPHIGRDRRSLRADAAVSVVAPQCMTADAMTKVAMTDRSLACRLLDAQGGFILEADGREHH